MRIAVMGAGGVGGGLGGLLAKSGNDVSLIARGEHLESIRENGLKIIRPGSEFIVEVDATDNPLEVDQVDLILFTVKTFQNRHVITSLKPLMGPNTSVITFQTVLKATNSWARFWVQITSFLVRIGRRPISSHPA